MPNENSWEAFLEEFERINDSEKYRPFQLVLDKLKPAIEYAETSSDEHPRRMARVLLAVVKHLQAERAAGRDAQVQIDQISGGFVEPGWFVEGDVKQANKDFIDKSTKYVVNVFSQIGPRLDLSTYAPTIPVPIVLVVMTRGEAQELITGDAFPEPYKALLEDFALLHQHLQEKHMDWLDRYGDTPKQWKPLGSGQNDVTIEQLVTKAFQGLEQELDEFDRPLVPDFKDIHMLTQVENRSSLRRMRNKGCIVILDIISMRHPNLQRACHQSLLDAYPKTSILSIAPSGEAYQVASDLAILVECKLEEMEFYRRMSDLSGDVASMNLYDKLGLNPVMNWLTSRVKTIELPASKKRRGVPSLSDT